jgi:hypothetical protein
VGSGFTADIDSELVADLILTVISVIYQRLKSFECHTRVTDMLVFQVFTTFEKLGISVDVLATSEVSISLTLDPSKLWSRELIQHVRLSPADLL